MKHNNRIRYSLIYIFIGFLCFITNGFAFTQQQLNTPTGFWLTFDDKTKKARGIVEIYQEKDGSISGKTLGGLYIPGLKWSSHCKGCIKPFTDQELDGMRFMWGFKKEHSHDNKYKGSIFDPDSKTKIYKSKLWLTDGGKNLKVRGYILFLYRTQTWQRLDNEQLQQYLAQSKKDKKQYADQ